MVKLLIYYSLNHNKFKVKVTRNNIIHRVGYINQFDEVLLKVINEDDLVFTTPNFFSRLYKFFDRKEKPYGRC